MKASIVTFFLLLLSAICFGATNIKTEKCADNTYKAADTCQAVLTNQTVAGITTSSANISTKVNVDTGGGTLYGYLSDSSTSPTPSDLMNCVGAIACDSISTPTANSTYQLSFNGLDTGTTYHVYLLHVNLETWQSAIVSTNFSTSSGGTEETPAPSSIVFYQNFDSGTGTVARPPDGWTSKPGPGRYSASVNGIVFPEYQSTKVYMGAKALKFHVLGTQSSIDAGTTPQLNYRCEITTDGYNRDTPNWEGTIHWIGEAIQLADDWPTNENFGMSITQTHNESDQPGSSPVWGLEVDGPDLLIHQEIVNPFITPQDHTIPGVGVSSLQGGWHKLVFQVKYSGTTNGFIRIWLDDVQIVGPNASLQMENIITWEPSATNFGFYKFGLYPWYHKRDEGEIFADKTSYVDEIRIADAALGGNYATVDPANDVTPP